MRERGQFAYGTKHIFILPHATELIMGVAGFSRFIRPIRQSLAKPCGIPPPESGFSLSPQFARYELEGESRKISAVGSDPDM